MRELAIWGKNVLGREDSKCKGPEVGLASCVRRDINTSYTALSSFTPLREVLLCFHLQMGELWPENLRNLP